VKAQLRIDFVSDVVCPWCIIGLKSLEQALERTRDLLDAELHFQPFELNPQMPAEGQDIAEHVREKYGISAEQAEQNREVIRQRGAALGFTFDMSKRGRIYNTFAAHRLLHWAERQGRQLELKKALFLAYFSAGLNISDEEVLADTASKAGLDPERARLVLKSGEFAGDVRAREHFYLNNGIHAVPAVIVNNRHLVQGGQPVETFERALRQVALQESASTPERS
jgi:predicted DsbA family dithiol-disulfide isomerase